MHSTLFFLRWLSMTIHGVCWVISAKETFPTNSSLLGSSSLVILDQITTLFLHRLKSTPSTDCTKMVTSCFSNTICFVLGLLVNYHSFCRFLHNDLLWPCTGYQFRSSSWSRTQHLALRWTYPPWGMLRRLSTYVTTRAPPTLKWIGSVCGSSTRIPEHRRECCESIDDSLT